MNAYSSNQYVLQQINYKLWNIYIIKYQSAIKKKKTSQAMKKSGETLN